MSNKTLKTVPMIHKNCPTVPSFQMRAVVVVAVVVAVVAVVVVPVVVVLRRLGTATAPAAPKPQPAGTTAVKAFQGSGYVHPAIGVGAGVLSSASNHPLPDTMGFPAEPVKVGTGSV